MTVEAAMAAEAAAEDRKLDAAAAPLARLHVWARVLEAGDGLDTGIPRVSTGLPRLDAALGGGFAMPSLNVIGAGPKSFKSTLAQIIATQHVEAGGTAYMLDLENGSHRFLRRLLCPWSASTTSEGPSFARPGRPWKPGESGNLRGRPREAPDLDEMRDKHGIEVLAELVRLALHAKKESVRRAACSDLADRFYGRPAMAILAAVAEVPAVDAEALRASLAARLEAIAAAGAAEPPPALPGAPAAAEAVVEVSAAAHLPVEKVVAAVKCPSDRSAARVEASQGADQGATPQADPGKAAP